jgi:alkylation response protein AidB-like acyl-CoA dehydrogenase
MKSPGITINPLISYEGLHIFNEVFFDNVRIPVSNLVGEENKGWRELMVALDKERSSIAPVYIGYIRRILDELIQYVKETQYEGRILSQNPIIRHKLAERATEAETLKLLTYQTIWKMSQGITPVYEASRDKVFNDEVSERLSITGTEILGAYSQVDSDSKWAKIKGILQHFYLIFPGMSIAAGTDDIERNIVGEFGLGLPKSY